MDAALDDHDRDGQDRRQAPHDLRFSVPGRELLSDGHPGRSSPGRAGPEKISVLLPFILLLSFSSGVAALIYEIVWFQILELVVGSSAVSLAVLLATFMGGTCLGSLLLPRIVPARYAPLKVYAVIELGIAILAILVLLVSPFISGVGFRGIVAAICLMPPTLLMGATLPALAREVEAGPEACRGWDSSTPRTLRVRCWDVFSQVSICCANMT